MSTVIGLAFGNTSTAIGYEKDGKADLIANQDGERSIPTIISYVDNDEYHGIQAKPQLIRNAKNTVSNFRDFIGIQYSEVDPTYSHASAHPIEEGGKVGFTLKNTDQDAKFVSVEEVSVRHLTRIRESASDFLGKPIDGAVLALPSDFSAERKEAIVSVAKEAGIKVLQVINEPSAALLAHVAARNTTNEDKIYVVADFGGTRSDGAVIAVRGGMFTILATHHDYELGGSKLDDAFIGYIAKEFEKQHSVDPMTDARAIAKMKAEVEVAKKTLSNTTSSNFAVESLSQGIDYNTTVNRLRFELVGRPIFAKFASFVEELVKKAELDPLAINEVLLVGGSSFIPKIASSVGAVFSENTNIIAPSTDSKAIPPNELVARGAAIQASLISGFDDEEIAESLQPVVTVAPHTTKPIGVVNADGSFTTVIDAFTPVPIRKTKVFEASGPSLIKLSEANSEIEVTKLEKPPKEEKAEDDDESDWSDEEDEDEEVRKLVYKPNKEIAELALKGAGQQVEVVLNITKDSKLQIAARDTKNGDVAARGEIAH